jgi:CSLREA domain-containing protein
MKKFIIGLTIVLLAGLTAGYFLTDFESLKGDFGVSDGSSSLPGDTSHYTHFTVTKTTDTADGVCDSDCSLREAIDAANSEGNDVLVEVPAGTYTLSILNTSGNESLNVSGDLNIGNYNYEIIIEGEGSDATIIDGGGIHMNDRVMYVKYSTNVKLENLTIQNGYTASNNGGGIYNLGELEIDECTITGSYGNSGGNIMNGSTGNMLIQESTISYGDALNAGGGIVNSIGGILTIEDSTIENNYTSYNGGGIYNYNSTLNIRNSIIKNNEANANGGGILNTYASYMEIYSSEISGNTSRTSGGGGIYNSTDSTILADQTTIENNFSGQNYGGGISNSGSGAYFQLSNSEVNSNIASDSGGGFANLNQAEMIIENSTISDNEATNLTGGGGQNGSTSTLTITDSEFNMNTSGYRGGALYIQGETNISKSSFNLNESITGGGGAITNEGTLSLETSTISNNTAGDDGCHFGGGGLQNLNIATISQSSIANNTSIKNGGGIFNGSGDGELEIANTTIHNNQTTDTSSSGGAIYNQTGDITNISFSTIEGNTSISSAGGIYGDNTEVSIINTIVSNNTLSGTTTVENCSNELNSYGYNLEDIDTCGFDQTGDLTNTDPRLDLAGLTDNGGLTNTIAIMNSWFAKRRSPAINAGICQDIDNNVITVDQRDFARDASCDIGAYEVQ